VTSEPGADELAAARAAGANAAREVITSAAPADPLLLVAWTAGFGSEGDIAAAVTAARNAGAPWRAIAEALDANLNTVMVKFGTGYERQRRYRERKRSEGDT
jgi:hypothetical protein